MLKDAINFLDLISHNIIFISNFLVFLGGGYIALHSRVMPKWVVTCLWYTGLAALLNCITIFVEWTAGQTHPLSHFQIGAVTETMVHGMLAVMVCLLFFHTVWKDYLGSRARRKQAIDVKAAVKGARPVKKVLVKKPTRGRPPARKISPVIKDEDGPLQL